MLGFKLFEPVAGEDTGSAPKAPKITDNIPKMAPVASIIDCVIILRKTKNVIYKLQE